MKSTMKTNLYNLDNKVIGEIDLSDAIFGRAWNPDLVHQVVVAMDANARLPWAHTKTRGEVRGGGKKPWKQKGTGRARHGSTRSPIWVGGGITFGPRNDRNYSQKVNKKMLRAALHSVLAKKFQEGEVKIVSDFTSANWKTKSATAILKKLGIENASIIPSLEDKNLKIATRNLKKISCLSATNLNISDIIRHKSVVISADSVTAIR